MPLLVTGTISLAVLTTIRGFLRDSVPVTNPAQSLDASDWLSWTDETTLLS